MAMLRMVLLLSLAQLLLAQSSTLPSGAGTANSAAKKTRRMQTSVDAPLPKSKGPTRPGASAQNSQISPLREAMLKWYCPSHKESVACQASTFIQSLRSAASPEEKKKLLMARQQKLSGMTPEDKKKYSTSARADYTTMYKEYCSPTAAIENAKPEVCTNPIMKKMYGGTSGAGIAG